MSKRRYFDVVLKHENGEEELVGNKWISEREVSQGEKISYYINNIISEKILQKNGREELEELSLALFSDLYQILRRRRKRELEITENKYFNERIRRVLKSMPIDKLVKLSNDFIEFSTQPSTYLIGDTVRDDKYSPVKEILNYVEENPSAASLLDNFITPEFKTEIIEYITHIARPRGLKRKKE